MRALPTEEGDWEAFRLFTLFFNSPYEGAVFARGALALRDPGFADFLRPLAVSVLGGLDFAVAGSLFGEAGSEDDPLLEDDLLLEDSLLELFWSFGVAFSGGPDRAEGDSESSGTDSKPKSGVVGESAGPADFSVETS